MIACIKRFICNYWFGDHDWNYKGSMTINGITEQKFKCDRCDKVHYREVY
ncbi:hypothetical protein [Bacillus sp. Fil]